MKHTPKMLLPLAYVREILSLLEFIVDRVGHDRSRGCCPAHRLHEAIAFRVRIRVKLDDWKREDAESADRWDRGERYVNGRWLESRGRQTPRRVSGNRRRRLKGGAS